MFKVDKFDIDWDRILRNDPMKCAQSLICQIFGGAEEDNEDGKIIKSLVE